jgi:hypothetical protein
VVGDAGITADRDRNGQRDQLLGLGVERTGRQRCLTHFSECGHRIGRAFAQLTDRRVEALGHPWPILEGGRHCRILFSLRLMPIA